MYINEIRAIVAQHAQLSAPVESLRDDSDLYAAGMSSLSTVNLMLALEDHFGVEFKDSMLGRKTFGSLHSLAATIEELRSVPASK
jgi:acyl carrier protein